MYYTAQQGVRQTWRNNLLTLEEQFKESYWLPTIATLLIIAWIALVIMGFRQSIFVSPHVPDHTKVGSGGHSLNVTNAAVVASSTPVSSSTTPTSTGTGLANLLDMASVTSQAQASSQVTAGAGTTNIGGIVGGKGADDTPVSTVTDPVTTVVDSTPLPVDANVTTDGGTTGISVNATLPSTPVTNSIPLSVDVSLPVSLPVAGGLL